MRIYLVILILIISFLLRIYKLNDLMPFIGDHAWFYISARDMILTGEIPLVGITSSHTWVHQGPLWTYLLAIPLFISNFNPVSGAYLTALLGVVGVFLIYKAGVVMFSERVAFIAALFYATSPLVIIHSRTPYHTSPIPLVTLLFMLSIFKWVKGDIRFFPLVVFLLGIMYNLELATMVFWILLIVVFAYGFIEKEKWIKSAFKIRVLFLSVFLFFLPTLPMILYDLREQTGFFQSTAFFRLIKIYLFSGNFSFTFEGIREVSFSLFIYNQRLVFLANAGAALLLTLTGFVYLIFSAYKRHKNQQATISNILVGLFFVLPLFGIILSGVASDAYIPLLFPAVIFSISLIFDYVYKRNAFVAIVVIFIIVTANSYMLIEKNYFSTISFFNRLEKAEQIIKRAKGREYNLIGKGEGSQHESFTMNYEYLTWWLGHPPSKNAQKLKFFIEEK